MGSLLNLDCTRCNEPAAPCLQQDTRRFRGVRIANAHVLTATHTGTTVTLDPNADYLWAAALPDSNTSLPPIPELYRLGQLGYCQVGWKIQSTSSHSTGQFLPWHCIRSSPPNNVTASGTMEVFVNFMMETILEIEFISNIVHWRLDYGIWNWYSYTHPSPLCPSGSVWFHGQASPGSEVVTANGTVTPGPIVGAAKRGFFVSPFFRGGTYSVVPYTFGYDSNTSNVLGTISQPSISYANPRIETLNLSIRRRLTGFQGVTIYDTTETFPVTHNLTAGTSYRADMSMVPE